MGAGQAKAEIAILGLNHRTAPIEVRERLAFANCGDDPLELLRRLDGLEEVIFLSTCNRVEVIFTASCPEKATEEIKDLFSSANQISRELFEPHLYFLRGQEAVRHIFRVASSLDSMVLGEPQILGQLKEAYRQAATHRTTGVILNRLMHKTFFVAKRVRTETGIASHAVSISYAAVELARKIFGNLSDKSCLLIGAGEMAELAAQHLLAQGAAGITVANRTFERAVELAQRFRGQPARLEEVADWLLKVDIVISSTGAPGYIITYDQVRGIMRPRRMRPLFFIDIAVPRDIEPEVNKIDNVYVYDIDDLKTVVEENRSQREKEALRAERIIEEEILKFYTWLEGLDVVPTIKSIRAKAEEIRRRELAKTLAHIGNQLSPEQIEAIEILTSSIVNKILHDPIIFLKNRYHQDGSLVVDMARKLFNLNGDRPLKPLPPLVRLRAKEEESEVESSG
ncbi:glutamyl-tRNA reductase [Thermosulfuriphilus sp.]